MGMSDERMNKKEFTEMVDNLPERTLAEFSEMLRYQKHKYRWIGFRLGLVCGALTAALIFYW
tara:strand:+ start:368 stop:553 length:186 start_codon:yes stop_codon:yes gene_type:complete